MSTRSVFTFKDDFNEFHVYKHCDGYPSGALEAIEKTLQKAWELPRFEAADFGAAFIAANKSKGGNVHLTHSYENHGDLSYRYEITSNNGEIFIHVYEAAYFLKEKKYKEIFSGNIKEMKTWIRREKMQ